MMWPKKRQMPDHTVQYWSAYCLESGACLVRLTCSAGYTDVTCPQVELPRHWLLVRSSMSDNKHFSVHGLPALS